MIGVPFRYEIIQVIIVGSTISTKNQRKRYTFGPAPIAAATTNSATMNGTSVSGLSIQ